MKTSNPYLLAEIDRLEDLLDIDANELEVVKHIDSLTKEKNQLQREKAELVDMLKYCKKAFLNQIEFDLVRDSAKQETKEIAESINKLLDKYKCD